jgi:hypothetical protein
MKKLGIQVGDHVKTRVSYKSIPRNAKGIVKALTQLTAPAAEKNPFAPAVINVPSFEQAQPTIKVSAEPGEKQAPPAKTIRVTEKPPKSLYAAFSPLRESLRPAYVPVSIIVPAPAGAPKTIEINPVPKYLSPGTKRLPAGSMLPQSLQKTLQVPAPVKSLPAPKQQEAAPNKHNERDRQVSDIPVKSINIKREWFQNRATPYSERSVQNIVDAANAGQFNWANMDAVTLWAGPDSKLYMLSGHSRLEAFERLCAAGKQEFCNIPAKIATVSLSEAKKIALESNTLSTKETDIERAEYYRKARENFATSKQIEEDAKRLEGANWTTIVAYSYLYPSGKTWNALNLLQSAEATSQNNIKTIAKWIGNAVKRLPQLTVSHENEIYDWLVTNRGYGTRAGQISKETEFATRLAAIVNKRTQWGVLDERLNIQNNVVLSPVERQYNAQLDEAKERINELEKQLKDKQADLIKRGATDAQIIELTAPINAAIQKAKLDLRRLVDNRDEVASYAKQEQNLFSNMAGRRGARFKLYA